MIYSYNSGKKFWLLLCLTHVQYNILCLKWTDTLNYLIWRENFYNKRSCSSYIMAFISNYIIPIYLLKILLKIWIICFGISSILVLASGNRIWSSYWTCFSDFPEILKGVLHDFMKIGDKCLRGAPGKRLKQSHCKIW